MSKLQDIQALVRRGEATPDLSQPSLVGLSYLLRHRELWPQGFKWDYTYRNTCAMGLTIEVWEPWPETSFIAPDQFTALYGLTLSQARDLFVNAHLWARERVLWFWSRPVDRVTPIMIADRIDKMLAAAQGATAR